MQRADFICKILTADGATGSGYLVASDLVLTCRHVVKSVRAPDTAEVCWPAIHPEKRIEATVVWRGDDDLDAALLRVEVDEVPARAVPGYLATERIQQTTPIHAGGYPNAGTGIGGYVAVHGQAAPLPESGPLIALHIEQQLEDKTQWGGLSGAPVFADTTPAIIGIVQSLPTAFTGQDLHAVCAASLLADETFADLIQSEARREHRERVIRALDRILSEQTTLGGWLGQRLRCEPERAAAALLDLGIIDFLRRLNDTQIHAVRERDYPAKQAVADILCHALPLVFARGRSYGELARFKSSGLLFQFAAADVALVEILAAAAEGRPVELLGQGVDPEEVMNPEFVRGRMALSGTPPCGGDPVTLKRDFHDAMIAKFGPSGTRAESRSRADLIKDASANITERAIGETPRRWYYIYTVHSEDVERFAPVMAELQDTYPDLPMIQLLDDEGEEGRKILWLITYIINRAEHDYSTPS